MLGHFFVILFLLPFFLFTVREYHGLLSPWMNRTYHCESTALKGGELYLVSFLFLKISLLLLALVMLFMLVLVVLLVVLVLLLLLLLLAKVLLEQYQQVLMRLPLVAQYPHQPVLITQLLAVLYQFP